MYDTDALRAANAATIESWREYLDLRLPVSVELGRARLTVRDVLALEPHSILQLSRSTGEGVDILAGANRVAQGQIVMLEDRMGVRINNIERHSGR